MEAETELLKRSFQRSPGTLKETLVDNVKPRPGFIGRPRLILLMDKNAAGNLFAELSKNQDLGCILVEYGPTQSPWSTTENLNPPFIKPTESNPFIPAEEDHGTGTPEVVLYNEAQKTKTGWTFGKYVTLNEMIRDQFPGTRMTDEGQLSIFAMHPKITWGQLTHLVTKAAQAAGIKVAPVALPSSDPFGEDRWPVSFRPLSQRGLFAPPGTYKVTRTTSKGTSKRTARKNSRKTKKMTTRKTGKKSGKRSGRKTGKKSGKKSGRKSSKKSARKGTKTKRGGDQWLDESEGEDDFHD